MTKEQIELLNHIERIIVDNVNDGMQAGIHPLTGVDVLDDKQLCALLNTNPRVLRVWRSTRGLPFVKITNKIIRYRRADIDQWLARKVTAIVK
jgi:hypothetical protein